MSKEEAGGSLWKKLVPDKKAIMEFFKSKEGPKLLSTAPAGIYLLSKQFENMNPFLKILSKTPYRASPVDLREGGVIVAGRGSKGLQIPDYDTIVKHSRKFFKARRNGLELPTPFMDVLGMTETLTALIDNYDVMGKITHPLQEVLLIDPKTFKLVREPDRDVILGIFDPLAVPWLEVFLSRDIMRFKYSNRHYRKEFQYARRSSKDEGWELQRACGGILEEVMSSG
ncbi:MAG: hypothetical protein ACO2OS_00640 [Thermosphaera aggregans]|uniref:hypothetical protein n=1 Tax=Thermosphaera aggregans TaxID=54254 RepID=UPI003C02D59F